MNHNCPFYGMHQARSRKALVLVASGGNQCAIVTTAYMPCQMETRGQTPDWRMCPAVALIRLHPVEAAHEPK